MASTAAATWHVLLDGNARFMNGTSVHPHQSKDRREELVLGQSPSVCIVGCADSRVSPEMAFDRGLGDIFSVRTAANVIDRAVLGTVEYATEQLDVPLLLVMGHTRCGGLTAACTAAADGNMPGGYLNSVVESLLPSVLKGRHDGVTEADDIIADHVRATMGTLHEQSASVRTKLREGALTLAGCVYHLESGAVELVGVQGSDAEEMLTRRKVNND